MKIDGTTFTAGEKFRLWLNHHLNPMNFMSWMYKVGFGLATIKSVGPAYETVYKLAFTIII